MDGRMYAPGVKVCVGFAVEALRGTLTGDQGVDPMCGSDASVPVSSPCGV